MFNQQKGTLDRFGKRRTCQ